MATGLAISLSPGTIVGSITHVTDEKREWPSDVEKAPIPSWDTGVFVTELANLDKLPAPFTDLTSDQEKASQANPESLLPKAQAQAPRALDEGTYRGTQLALTKMYQMVEQR